MEMTFFSKSQVDQYSFIRIPKDLVTGETFSSLSVSAKILYGMLLDRMAIAAKNSWMDEKGRVYIHYQISEIQEDINISKRKAVDCLAELEEIGLIQKKRKGCGLPNQIYVKNFIVNERQQI